MAHFRATELSHLRLEEAAKHRRELLIQREELQLECKRRVERCVRALVVLFVCLF